MMECNHREDARRQRAIAAYLAKRIDHKNARLMIMQRKINEKDKLLEAAREEIGSLKMDAEKLKHEMDSYRRKIDEQAQEIVKSVEKRQSAVHIEDQNEVRGIELLRQILEELEKELERTLEEKQKMRLDSDTLKCAMESQKKECNEKILEFQKFLEGTESIKLENEELNLKMESHKKELEQKIMELELSREELNWKLKEQECEIDCLKANNNVLMLKQRTCNDELQAAREEALRVLQRVLDRRTTIRIKRLGEIDQGPFQHVCLEKFPDGGWREESARLCTKWEKNIRNPHWHPFKIKDVNGEAQRIIDEDDAMLKELRSECGEYAYQAVIRALLEVEEYNPSGRYPISEVWNPSQDRKATLEEIIAYMGKKLSKKKRCSL